jgi:cytochrome oxidase Cu insertion factor (SCO1/SenC/PrrC family)
MEAILIQQKNNWTIHTSKAMAGKGKKKKRKGFEHIRVPIYTNCSNKCQDEIAATNKQ